MSPNSSKTQKEPDTRTKRKTIRKKRNQGGDGGGLMCISIENEQVLNELINAFTFFNTLTEENQIQALIKLQKTILTNDAFIEKFNKCIRIGTISEEDAQELGSMINPLLPVFLGKRGGKKKKGGGLFELEPLKSFGFGFCILLCTLNKEVTVGVIKGIHCGITLGKVVTVAGQIIPSSDEDIEKSKGIEMIFRKKIAQSIVKLNLIQFYLNLEPNNENYKRKKEEEEATRIVNQEVIRDFDPKKLEYIKLLPTQFLKTIFNIDKSFYTNLFNNLKFKDTGKIPAVDKQEYKDWGENLIGAYVEDYIDDTNGYSDANKYDIQLRNLLIKPIETGTPVGETAVLGTPVGETPVLGTPGPPVFYYQQRAGKMIRKPLDKCTVVELKAKAAKRGIKVSGDPCQVT